MAWGRRPKFRRSQEQRRQALEETPAHGAEWHIASSPAAFLGRELRSLHCQICTHANTTFHLIMQTHKVQPVVCWILRALLARANCARSFSVLCSMASHWCWEFGRRGKIHTTETGRLGTNRGTGSGERIDQHAIAQESLPDDVNGKCRRDLHTGGTFFSICVRSG